VTLATRELGVLESQVAPVEAQVSAAEYTIATLLGQYPRTWSRSCAGGDDSLCPRGREAGLPLDLCGAGRKSCKRNGAGRLDRPLGRRHSESVPQISLSAAIGAQRQTTPCRHAHLVRGVGAVWPLLDFGSLDAQVEAAGLRTRAQLVNYRRTIQDAVKEVDTTWSAYAAQQERLAKLGDALVASQRAVTLANERYVRGSQTF